MPALGQVRPAFYAVNSLDLRTHVAVVVPQSDHRPGKILLVAQRAQAGRTQHKVSAVL